MTPRRAHDERRRVHAFAEERCEDVWPRHRTPDEIAEDAAEYAGNNGLLHDVDPPCVEGRDVLKEQPATGGRCEYRGKEENFAEGFEAVVKIRLLVLILRTVVGMLGVFIAASDETRGQGEQRDGQAKMAAAAMMLAVPLATGRS